MGAQSSVYSEEFIKAGNFDSANLSHTYVKMFSKDIVQAITKKDKMKLFCENL